MRAGSLAAMLLAAACTSPNAPSSAGARDTGTYPNLNIKPQAANEQLTNDQIAADKAALTAASRANASQRTPVKDDVALLRKIGDTHAKEALAEIEGQKPQ